jgi:hydrogenase expression/formation protein HypC
MCLGVPGKVLSVEGWTATVDFWGVRKQVLLNIVDEPVAPGDYILNHVGFAIRRIPPESVAETLALYESLLNDDVSDLMTGDVRGEIEGLS